MWAKNRPKLVLVVTRLPAVQRCLHKQVVLLLSSQNGTKIIEFLAQDMHFLDPSMAANCAADQLIGWVGSGTRAVSRKTPIYFIIQRRKDEILRL